jgi:predicted nucleic-acid-binding Zn-ribbon protein
MADEEKKDPELEAVQKALREHGRPFRNREELLKVLDAAGMNATATAQKHAAETNLVDVELANIWFAKHWPEPRKCPICSQNNWGMSQVFAHTALSPLGRHTPVLTTPSVTVTCRNCGNTLFFNAIIMGLLAESAEQ